jgi:hypothetical protein
MQSDEQRGFTEELDALISRYLGSFGFHESNVQVGDWVLIISAPSLDSIGNVRSGYSVAFSGQMLEHHALGLLTKAEEIVMGRDEDD